MWGRGPKFGRNNLCPCGSGKKFKQCCKGKIDWDAKVRAGAASISDLSIQGRNLYFLTRLVDILQLDSLDSAEHTEASGYKNAFTADAVKAIHEAVVEIWPLTTDIQRILAPVADDVSSLYIGDYDPNFLARAIVRQSVYAGKILIVDPFIYPPSVRDEYNPILNPDQFRQQTLKNTNLWFSLMPWILAGIVEIIRTPGDFDWKLNLESLERQQKKFDQDPRLKKSLEISVEEFSKRHMNPIAFEELLLGAPDSYLKQIFDAQGWGQKGESFDDFLADVQRRRNENINFLAPLSMGPNSRRITVLSSGASYDMAKIIAGITRSYLVTDLHSRWVEIEIDRGNQNPETKVWSPFSKAFQETPLHFLNGISLSHALQLRSEGRLESLRNFLHRVWKKARMTEQFDSANALELAEELKHEIAIANEEWKKIDKDLIKTIKKELRIGAFAAGPLIATGHGSFLAAGTAIAGTFALIDSTMSRRNFPDRYPAAFFMNISPPNQDS